ncbi:hypothetical protein H072_9508 [Dactylellina haptotyla CBS 200.50]|uniref:Uncharacterized protein n=1 Tax=Dactylellina haptotyla (strain CBS 200.50) TaxID=1284197 RepID=S8A2H0_DACHA|nr:hypothetical protein H072_9508 [Dactylellina haptotyla CBS 200.50]
MKLQVLGFLVASFAAVANCQSLDPAWGVGHFGGTLGTFDPRNPTPSPVGQDFTSTTTRFVTTYTTVTIPVTLQAAPRSAA